MTQTAATKKLSRAQFQAPDRSAAISTSQRDRRSLIENEQETLCFHHGARFGLNPGNMFQVCCAVSTWSGACTSCWRRWIPPSFARSTVSFWERSHCLRAFSQHRSEDGSNSTLLLVIDMSPKSCGLIWLLKPFFSLSVWLWRRDALRHYELQFRA